MAKSHTFTPKHYPVNELLALYLQEHVDQMVMGGGEIASIQQLILESSPTIDKITFFRVRNEER